MPHAKNNRVKQPLETGSVFILRCLNCHDDIFSFCMFSFMTLPNLFS